MIEQIPTTGTSTDAQELVERAKALRPLLQKNAAKTEDRRVPEESIQAIADAGLFRITVPRRYGGYEVNIHTKLEVSAALAEGCGSTAWVATLINVCNWFTGLLPQQAQDEIFGANPNAREAGVFAPSAKTRRVDDGLIVTGKWYYSSGSLHATWGLVGVPVVNESGIQVDQGLALIPMEQLYTRAGTQTVISKAKVFAVNILREDRQAIARQFATPHPDKFREIPIAFGELGVPLLSPILATIECRVVGEVTGGTHAVFLAEVQAAHAEEGMPLAYYRGRMGKFVFSAAESKAPLWRDVLQWEDYY